MVDAVLNQDNIEKGREIIADLVARFNSNKSFYTTSNLYKEEEAKVEFINPMMEALGWDVHNKQGLGPNFKEVVFEESLAVGKETRAPDYSFRLGGQLIYYLEAKKPSVNIKDDRSPAYQARRYGWSAKIPIVILTDFEELAVYETTSKPKESERASTDRVLYYTYEEYVEKWDEIYSIFSKEAVLKELFQKFVDDYTSKTKRGTQSIDNEFLKDIEKWRLLLARNIALRNKELTISELNLAVQLIIDRIVFFRMAEDRGIERYQTLYKLSQSENIYQQLCEVFKKADLKYNSGLFHFSFTPDYSEFVDNITLSLNIDDGVFKEIFRDLYYPYSPYEFSVISPEILGDIYENFLGSVIRLTPSHQAKIEQKPEVKKAGGVFYTPQYIVDYIVENTVGELIKGKTPNQISKLRILDPACGSGSFLLRAFQKLLDYHLEYYIGLKKPPKEVYYVGKDNVPRLTIREKKRILTNNIYGVDIDVNAVEVTKLSLLLKVLEDENKDVLEQQQKLYQEKVLPNLSYNIKCGNSLIGTDILNQEDLEHEDILKLNPFNWEHEFQLVFANGGFDAVIGNPPYVLIQPKDTPKYLLNYYKTKFYVSQYKIDLYHLFYEKGISVLKNNGYFGYITPSPYLLNIHLSKLRKFILDTSEIKKIINTGNDVFYGAKVDTAVIILKKEDNEKNRNKNTVKIYNKINYSFKHNNDKDTIQVNYADADNFVFNINITSSEWELLKKIDNHEKLGNLSRVSFGLQTKDKKKYVKDEPINENWKPCIDGKNIFPYYLSFSSQYFLHDTRIKAGGCWDEETHNTLIKIVIRQIGTYPIATIDKNRYYCLNTIYNITSLNEKYNYYYILAIINSNLIKFFWKSKFYDSKVLFPKVKKAYLDKIPIPEISIEYQGIFIELVNKMLDLNNKLHIVKTPKEEKLLKIQIDKVDEQINAKVYELYGLFDDEIEIIENSLKE